MKNSPRSRITAWGIVRNGLVVLATLLALGRSVDTHAAVTSLVTLADQPIFATNTVPGNMAFALSVEFPTAISVANLGNYSDSMAYGGYFDPAKCYSYQYNSTTPGSSYFQPAAFATGTNGHSCSGQWSGNFMNWATMQTIDPFRATLTGGYRSVDTSTQTILEKAWGARQGGTSNFPYRGTTQSTGNTATNGNNIAQSLVATVTPFTNWPQMNTGIWGNGNTMLIAAGSGYTASTFQNNVYDLPSDVNSAAPTPGQSYSTAVPNTASNVVTYRAYIRVSVCDTSVLGVMGLEKNCVGYGSPSGTVYPIYKPQGLMQQYANQIRYGVLGYLNTANTAVQGGVLREPMEFIGPTYPTPLSTTVTTNPTAEWDPATGIMAANPDPNTAGASGVSQSGVMNYINQFGEFGAKQYLAGNSSYANNQSIYMTYDNVSELYYAAIRYFENLGNVPQWLPQSSNGATSVQLDGFPAVTTWTDPITYRCQKNFILGIGDDHTWPDYNVGGSTQTGLNIGGHSPVPSAVSGDTFNKANTWLNELQALEGLSQQPFWGAGASQYATQYMAGLAYGAHVLDIRPDLNDTQTISTYWLDVAENQVYEYENPYYLAAKYGGFAVPSNYSITTTTPLTQGQYDTSGNSIVMNGNKTLPLPDNYFQAGNAAQMAVSLTTAFTNIALATQLNTTSFSFANNNSAGAGTYSFSSSYNSSGWTSTITGSTIAYSGNTPMLTQAWVSDTVLQSQFAGNGWQTNRKIVTWSNGSGCAATFTGVPFEATSLCATTQLNALASPTYSTATTGTQYLNYLRGDTTNQVGCTGSGCGTKSLRARNLFLGDVADSALMPVGTPALSYSEANDPGYAAFKSSWATRPTMVYAGANDGMLHGFLGSSGSEVFAYVPSPLYQGPTGTPQVNGLAQLGNPNYSHHYYVDATPTTLDVDLYKTYQSTKSAPCPENTTATCWSTLLVGGLGKGGTSFYALNVTDPASMQSANESQIAQNNVMWEYTDPTMGYSFGTPVMVKTAQYGWVVLLTSGYDNSDGYGYLYVVNPATGALLQKIKTPSSSSGLTQVSAYVQDYTDYTADSAYVGDLNGQLWRFDLTATSGAYPAPTLLAQLTDGSGNAEPVTSAPLIQIHPGTRLRYVLFGTGKLLTATDVGSTQSQSFYAIIDGNAGSFNKNVTTPVTRSMLTAVPDVTAAAALPASSKGFYVDLGAGYRVVSMATETNGVVGFAALLPSAGSDPCSPQGSSHVYALNYASGQSVLNSTTTGSPTTLPYIAFSNSITSLAFVNNGTVTQLVAGDSKGNITPVPTSQTTLATRTLNWREIPTPD